MVVDTSAIIATIGEEEDSPRYRDAMRQATSVAISAVTALETRIVLHSRLGADAVRVFSEMLQEAAMLVVPFDAEMAMAAFEAYRVSARDKGIRLS